MLVVDRLAGVLFQVQAGDADDLGGAVGQFDLDLAGADDGVFELADLIARGQIGVKIVLPVEAADGVDMRVKPEPGAHGLGDALGVDHRQHTRKGCIDEADLAVGFGSERRRGAAEQFRLADHLSMDFEADHDLPQSGAAFDRVGHGSVFLAAPGEHALLFALHEGDVFQIDGNAGFPDPIQKALQIVSGHVARLDLVFIDHDR